MAFTIDMFSPFMAGWTGGLGGPNSGGHSGSNWYIRYGMDLGVVAGTALYAAFAGHVTKFQPHVRANDTSKVYGAQLFMRSDNDMMGAFYTHFTNANIRVGQRIEMGDYLGETLREHLHMAMVEIIGGAPGGRYMGIDLYRDFVALKASANVIHVTFHQNGSPPTVSY